MYDNWLWKNITKVYGEKRTQVTYGNRLYSTQIVIICQDRIALVNRFIFVYCEYLSKQVSNINISIFKRLISSNTLYDLL